MEQAESQNNWGDDAAKAVFDAATSGATADLDSVGARMARDINDAVDRIRTGRLKHSMRHSIE